MPSPACQSGLLPQARCMAGHPASLTTLHYCHLLGYTPSTITRRFYLFLLLCFPPSTITITLAPTRVSSRRHRHYSLDMSDQGGSCRPPAT